MKKVLIHIGYPKAASTTLQNGLFLELHKKKAVNFLGRAFESGFYGARRDKAEYKNWFEQTLTGDTRGILYQNVALSEHQTNILSEGWFITHERYNDNIAVPQIVKEHFFPNADQTDLLVIIRNQADLIPSYYIQNYRRLNHGSFNQYISHNIKQCWAGDAKIFNFLDVLQAYAHAFGRDRMHILFFEDLVFNKDRFSVDMGKAINVEASIIRESLGQRQLNQTMKEPGKLVVRKFDKASLRYRLFQKLNRLSPSLAGSLRVRVPSISEQEKGAIREVFRSSNHKLAEEFSLDQHRMREYGYV